jgi:hypothetical protein
MIVQKNETNKGTIWYVTNNYHLPFVRETEMLIWCNNQYGNIDKLVHIRHFNKGWNFNRDMFIFRREEDLTIFLLAWSEDV